MSPCLSSPGPWHQPQDIPSHLLRLHLISLLSEFLQTTSPLSFFLPVFSSCHQAPGQALTFPGLTPSFFSMSAFSEYSLIATQRPFRLKPSSHVEEHANPGEYHLWQKRKNYNFNLQFFNLKKKLSFTNLCPHLISMSDCCKCPQGSVGLPGKHGTSSCLSLVSQHVTHDNAVCGVLQLGCLVLNKAALTKRRNDSKKFLQRNRI